MFLHLSQCEYQAIIKSLFSEIANCGETNPMDCCLATCNNWFKGMTFRVCLPCKENMLACWDPSLKTCSLFAEFDLEMSDSDRTMIVDAFTIMSALVFSAVLILSLVIICSKKSFAGPKPEVKKATSIFTLQLSHSGGRQCDALEAVRSPV